MLPRVPRAIRSGHQLPGRAGGEGADQDSPQGRAGFALGGLDGVPEGGSTDFMQGGRFIEDRNGTVQETERGLCIGSHGLEAGPGLCVGDGHAGGTVHKAVLVKPVLEELHGLPIDDPALLDGAAEQDTFGPWHTQGIAGGQRTGNQVSGHCGLARPAGQTEGDGPIAIGLHGGQKTALIREPGERVSHNFLHTTGQAAV